MIGGLQGDFGDLDIKYLKQNISKCWSGHQISKAKYLKMSVANIWKLQENTTALCKNGCETPRVSAIRGSGYV